MTIRLIGRRIPAITLLLALATPVLAHDEPNDQLIRGGGSEATDCMVQYYGGELNYPAPPKAAKEWRCYDGESPCDQSPVGDGVCEFAIGICLNGTGHQECIPSDAASILVKNKPIGNPRHDTGLGDLQTNINALGLPTAQQNLCTSDTAVISVPLKYGKPGKKSVQLKSASRPNVDTGTVTKDSDKLKLRCETCPVSGTFDNIAQFIFKDSCATGTCHVGTFPAGNLSLEAVSAHAKLVNVVPSNAAAAAAGMKLVDPGHPESSFLLEKLCGSDPGNPVLRPAVCAGHDLQIGALAEGDPMPPPTGGMSEAKINLIHDWIAAGAPASGWVAGTHCGVPPDLFEPIPAPPVPPGGFQLELPAYDLAPGQEIEGCMWVQVPIVAPLDVGSFEIRMNEGSHHFILYRYVDDPSTNPPVTGNWDPADAACIKSGAFQELLSASQDPVNVDTYPDGLARTIHPGDYIGLNSHYINTFNVPIQGHVYINFYPYAGTQPHKTAKTLFATEANFGATGIGVFGPGIKQFKTGITPGDWINPESGGACVVSLTSHMHSRGTKFIEQYPVGTQIYYNDDWDHPTRSDFDPPMWVPPSDVIHYECTHDNGFSNPAKVKRNSLGFATALKFGISADDEMCIMPGLYFVPAVAGNCSLP